MDAYTAGIDAHLAHEAMLDRWQGEEQDCPDPSETQDRVEWEAQDGPWDEGRDGPF